MSNYSKKVAKFAREWNKPESNKVYFKYLENLYGLTFLLDQLGFITSAILDGSEIDLNKALSLRSKLNVGLVYFDFEANEFGFYGLDPVIANCIIDEMRRRIEKGDYRG